MKLRWLRDAVVIRVLPQSQAGEDRISGIDHGITIATFCRFIKLSKRKKSISRNSRWWSGLMRRAAKQFTAIIDHSVAISVQNEPRVATAGSSPRKTIRDSMVIKVEIYTVRNVR
jgi:hypothetical protein